MMLHSVCEVRLRVRCQQYVAVPIHQSKVPMIVCRALAGTLRLRSFEDVVGLFLILRHDNIRTVLSEALRYLGSSDVGLWREIDVNTVNGSRT